MKPHPFLYAFGAVVVSATIAFAGLTVCVKVTQRLMEEQEELLRIRQAEMLVELRRQRDEATRALQDIADHIAVPPTNDKLFTILSKGIGVGEYAFRSSTVGATPAAAFTTDLTTAQQTDAFTQEITIRNAQTAGAARVCFKPISWAAAGATCTLKCAAQTITCAGGGAVNDGFLLQQGQLAAKRFDGTSCVCVVASGAGIGFQSERVLR